MGRTPCCEKAELKKGPWTTEEDQKLVDHIQKHGPANWRALPKKAGLQRCGKSCRLRWTNYLRPDIKRGKISTEEEETIIQLHRIMGNKWSAIAAKLPGRTDNEIKNYWNTHIRKRLLRMGIDPVTHGPRLDLLDLPSILTSLQPSLLNIPALLNLQTLLNPELLRFTPSQTRVQNNLSQSSSDSLFFAQAANQNESRILNPPFHTMLFNTTLTENLSNLCKVKVEQIGYQEKNNHVISEPSIKFDTADQGSLYQATEDSNQSVISDNNGFSSVFPESCSFPANSLGPSLEDDLDIESFFSNIVEKLENPVSLNVCTS